MTRSRADRNFGWRTAGIVRVLTGADVTEVAKALEILGLDLRDPGLFEGDLTNALTVLLETFSKYRAARQIEIDLLKIDIDFAIRELFEDPAPGEAEAGKALRIALARGVALQKHFDGLFSAVERIETFTAFDEPAGSA